MQFIGEKITIISSDFRNVLEKEVVLPERDQSVREWRKKLKED